MRPPDEYLSIEEFAARLKINPTDAIKALAAEIAAQVTKDISQLTSSPSDFP